MLPAQEAAAEELGSAALSQPGLQPKLHHFSNHEDLGKCLVFSFFFPVN